MKHANWRSFVLAIGLVIIMATLYPVGASADDSSFLIPLVGGAWNLVSIPFDVPDESVAGVLGSASSSVDSIYTYIDGNWQVYRADHPELSTLMELQPSFGYFIHTSTSTTITGRGTLFSASSTPPTRRLQGGWNLVGVFEPLNASSTDIDQVFGSIGFSGVDYLSLLRLDPVTQSFTTSDTAEVGDAFWMLLDGVHTYGPSNF